MLSKNYNHAGRHDHKGILWLRRFFWGMVHTATVVLIVSMFIGIHDVKSNKSSASSATVVKSAIRFPVHENAPDSNQVMDLINQKRREAGVDPLIAEARLSTLAESRASDMVGRSYYSHINPDGDDFYDLLAKTGFEPDFTCENLSLESDIAEDTSVQSWLISKNGHRECMLSPSTRIVGIAAVKMYDANVNGINKSFYLVVAIQSTQN